MANLPQSGKYKLQLLDLKGSLILQQTIKGEAGVHAMTLNLESKRLSDGAYFLALEDKEGNKVVRKLLKKTP